MWSPGGTGHLITFLPYFSVHVFLYSDFVVAEVVAFSDDVVTLLYFVFI